MFSLFKRKIWIFLKLFVCDDRFLRKWMMNAEKYMWLGNIKLVKFQIIGFQNFLQYVFVEFIEKQNANFTSHMSNIFNNFIGLCFAQTEIIFFLSIFLNQIHKSIDRKRVVLCGNTKFLFSTIVFLIFVLQDRSLF